MVKKLINYVLSLLRYKAECHNLSYSSIIICSIIKQPYIVTEHVFVTFYIDHMVNIKEKNVNEKACVLVSDHIVWKYIV